MPLPEYRVVIAIEEMDSDGHPLPDFVMSTSWDGATKLIHGITEAERVMKVLSAAKVPGA